jgi:hypothetical protein
MLSKFSKLAFTAVKRGTPHPLSSVAASADAALVTLRGPTARFCHSYPTEKQLTLGLSSGLCAVQEERQFILYRYKLMHFKS